MAITFSTIILCLDICIAATAQSTENPIPIKELVEDTAPLRLYNCISRAVSKNLPINNCTADIEEIILIMTRLHRQLYPNEKFRLEDFIGCCPVFQNDGKDPENKCFSTCQSMAWTPTLPTSHKMEVIKHCKYDNGPLYSCFEQCMGNPGNYTIKDDCIVNKTKPGRRYIGYKIRRRNVN